MQTKKEQKEMYGKMKRTENGEMEKWRKMKENMQEEEAEQRRTGTMTTIMTIKILNWNARGLSNKIEELIKRVYEYDVVVITETKRHNKEVLKIKGYCVLEKNSPKKEKSSGGIAILVRKDLKVKVLNEINF